MYLKYMRPEQIREAISRDLAVIVPIGCVECHGYHLPVGCDTLIVEEVARRLEARIDCVIAPTVDYGPTGYDVSGPELGTMDVAPEELLAYARGVLRGLLRLGFRRIVVWVFHQGDRGPLASTFHLAGTRLVEELMGRERGEGWWGAAKPVPSDRTFGIIEVRSVVHPKSSPPAGGDHAGLNETSYMLAACGQHVSMGALRDEGPWYTLHEGDLSRDGSAARGELMFSAMVAAWAEELAPPAAATPRG
jgi:creatinine amidohydrolase